MALAKLVNLVFLGAERETDRLLSRYLAAALTLAMLPAGEMWSVVTLSPRNSKAWALSIDWGGGTSLLWEERQAEDCWSFFCCTGNKSGATSIMETRNPSGIDIKTYQLAEKTRWADICGLVIPGEKHRIRTFSVVPKCVPFLEESAATFVNNNSRDSSNAQDRQPRKRDRKKVRRKRQWRLSPHLHPPSEIPKNGGDYCVLLSLLDLLPGRPDITKIELLALRCHACIDNRKSNFSTIERVSVLKHSFFSQHLSSLLHVFRGENILNVGFYALELGRAASKIERLASSMA